GAVARCGAMRGRRLPAPPGEVFFVSLHGALPISRLPVAGGALLEQLHAHALHRPRQSADQPGRLDGGAVRRVDAAVGVGYAQLADRKSTRLNSSHVKISYAVSCLTQKNEQRHLEV